MSSSLIDFEIPGTVHHQPVFQQVNFQPDQAKKGDKVCPHFELLLQAARLIGIEETAQNTKQFCGIVICNKSVPGRMFMEEDGFAETFCQSLVDALEKATSKVEKCKPEGDRYLKIWENIIPPIGGKKPRARTRKEMVLFVKRLTFKVKKTGNGDWKNYLPGKPLPGCTQYPAKQKAAKSPYIRK